MTEGDDQRIALTSTIPVEIIFAAGTVSNDLNNYFIIDPQNNRFLAKFKAIVFSQNTCNWKPS